MVTTVESALAAMDAAEQEARDHLAYKDRELEYGAPLYVEEWARDRLRLIARDRTTLERHQGYQSGYMDGGVWCSVDHDYVWPCPDVRAVIDYWQEDA